MNRKAFECPITKQDVEILIKRAVGDKTKILNYHLRTFSEEKVGFMGAHHHLVVTVQRNPASPEHEILSFFLKSVPYNIDAQAAIIEECNFFYKETNFYKSLMPEILSSVKDKSWTACCYLVKDDAMLFEDLKTRNFTVKEKILNMILLKSALSSMAKMHAASMLTEKRLGCSLLELYPEVLRETLFTREGRFYEGWFKNGVKVSVDVAQYLGLDVSNIQEIYNRVFNKFLPSKTRKNVVCHGDAWSYNLMFDDSKPVPQCILVDFQLVRYVPPMVDIVQLLYLTTRRVFRERNEKQLLKHYYQILCRTLKDNDNEIELPKLQDVLNEYEEMRLVGLVTCTLYFPISLVDGMKSAELTKDSDGFNKLLFEDRVDLVRNIMDEDPLYRDRIGENITEMVERSDKLLL